MTPSDKSRFEGLLSEEELANSGKLNMLDKVEDLAGIAVANEIAEFISEHKGPSIPIGVFNRALVFLLASIIASAGEDDPAPIRKAKRQSMLIVTLARLNGVTFGMTEGEVGTSLDKQVELNRAELERLRSIINPKADPNASK